MACGHAGQLRTLLLREHEVQRRARGESACDGARRHSWVSASCTGGAALRLFRGSDAPLPGRRAVDAAPLRASRACRVATGVGAETAPSSLLERAQLHAVVAFIGRTAASPGGRPGWRWPSCEREPRDRRDSTATGSDTPAGHVEADESSRAASESWNDPRLMARTTLSWRRRGGGGRGRRGEDLDGGSARSGWGPVGLSSHGRPRSFPWYTRSARYRSWS